jgi:hypothetical protein
LFFVCLLVCFVVCIFFIKHTFQYNENDTVMILGRKCT